VTEPAPAGATPAAQRLRFDRAGGERGRLYETVARAIEERILAGDLRPRDLLPPEHVLAEQFDVSRTVVREATKALEHAGLVEARQGLGVVVTAPSEGHVAESILRFVKLENSPQWALYELRSILETEAAARAAERRDEADLEILGSLIERMTAKVDLPLEYVELDLEFHRALLKAAHNPLFNVVLEPFRAALRESRQLGATVPKAPTRSVSSHRRIYEAIRSQDADLARREVEEHFEKVAEFLSEAGVATGLPQSESLPSTPPVA
jgi:GntR family transcriptional regulator, transcriptional repressor for pyruvate dehydrogenase complex